MTEELKTPATTEPTPTPAPVPEPPKRLTEILRIDKIAGIVEIKETIPEHEIVSKVNRMMTQRQLEVLQKQKAHIDQKIADLQIILDAFAK